ncbi:MAG: type II toxin-antitoxin system Phd/YefM family antitoxin [Planctomycetota bacterium]
MKPIQVASDIVPIGEFKAHASEVLRGLRVHMRPVIITQSGKPTAVLLAAEEFDRLTERARFIEAVEAGLQDSKNGRVTSDVEMGRVLNRELGPPK